MKKCPTCGSEFDDSMKFCQVDGKELVADEPAFDPYATVVGHKLHLAPEAEKPIEHVLAAEIVEEPEHQTVGSTPIAEPDELLELPGLDPLKTMYVSEAELKEVFDAEQESTETPTVESFKNDPPTASFGGAIPPPSPFSTPESPFDPPQTASSPFADAETVVADRNSPFRDSEPAPVAEWNQPVVSNSLPAYGAEAQSKGLAIGSLVCGVLSCTICCSMGILLGPAALVMGFMAKKKAEESPSEFGGRGLALGGMISGAVGVLFGLGIILYYIIVGVAAFSGGLPN